MIDLQSSAVDSYGLCHGMQAAMPSPAGTWASEVESFASTPESGEIRPSTGRNQAFTKSRLAAEVEAAEETHAQAEAKNIFANWDDDDDEVVI